MQKQIASGRMTGADVQGDFRINDWLIQPQINTVERNGKTWHLEPKVMQVLVHLASHPDEVLSKERLIDAIWRDTFVGDDVLIRCISEIRYVFGDDARSSHVIQTIPKAGYRLIAAVTTELGTGTSLAAAKDHATLGKHNNETDRGLHVIALGSDANELDKKIATSLSVNSEPPQRFWLVEPGNDGLTEPEAISMASPATADDSSSIESGQSRRRPWFVAIGVVGMLLCVGAVFLWRSAHPSAFEVFWGPIVNTPDSALFCIADQNQYTSITLRDAADPSHQVVLKDNLSAVVIDDLDAIVKIASVLRANGKRYTLKGEEVTSLMDLRNGPSIFVGAFDNAWTLRLTKSLRYHFSNNPEMTQFRIVDSANPSQMRWSIERSQQMATNNYQDFAIVARFTDSITGKPAVVIAGIGRGGTIAAGEFLTDPDDLAQLLRAVRAAGGKKNMEIVLSTQIIDGQPGTSKMEASYFW
jgi:DNA-binding winged helix-turn-helix (wHTH) protein